MEDDDLEPSESGYSSIIEEGSNSRRSTLIDSREKDNLLENERMEKEMLEWEMDQPNV